MKPDKVLAKPKVGEYAMIINEESQFHNSVYEITEIIIRPGGPGIFVDIEGEGETQFSVGEYIVVATEPAPRPRYHTHRSDLVDDVIHILDDSHVSFTKRTVLSVRNHPDRERFVEEELERLNTGYY